MTDPTTTPPTVLDVDEFAAVLAAAAEMGTGIDVTTGRQLLDEVRRLQAVLDAEKSQHLFTLRQRNNRSKRLALLHDLALAGDVEQLLAKAKDTLAASIDDHLGCGERATTAPAVAETGE